MIQVKDNDVICEGDAVQLMTELSLLMLALHLEYGIPEEMLQGSVEIALTPIDRTKKRHAEFLDSLEIGEALAFVQASNYIKNRRKRI